MTPALGGLAVAFAKSALAGRLGMELELEAIPAEGCNPAEVLFSESHSRFVATVSPEKAPEFESLLAGSVFARVGRVTPTAEIRFTGKSGFSVTLEDIRKRYQRTLDQV